VTLHHHAPNSEVVHTPFDSEYGMHDFRVRDADGYVLAFGKVPE